MDNKKFSAVLKTLRASVRTGLNASLSPSDCRLLIEALQNYEPPIDRMVRAAGDLAHGIVDDLFSDLSVMTPPKRRRKK